MLTILAHLEKEPVPLPELRPDVPVDLWAVVAKMLAKEPGRRFQTPAEAARAFLPFIEPGLAGAAPPPRKSRPGAATHVGGARGGNDAGRMPLLSDNPTIHPPDREKPSAATVASPFAGLGEATPEPREGQEPARSGRRRGFWLRLAGAASLTVAVGLVLLAALHLGPHWFADLKARDGGQETPQETASTNPLAQGTGVDAARVRERRRRQGHWHLNLNMAGQSYLEILANTKPGNGAILAIPQPDGKTYRVIRDLLKRPATGEIEDISKFDAVPWVDDNPQSVASVARDLGIAPTPPLIIAFYPEELEEHLAKLEHDFYGLSEDRIELTVFKVIRSPDGTYHLQVESQKLKP